jgi:hypothetical protein
MIITGSEKKQSKVILTTSQVRIFSWKILEGIILKIQVFWDVMPCHQVRHFLQSLQDVGNCVPSDNSGTSQKTEILATLLWER